MIDCEVGFIDQLRVGQYKKQLNEDLKKLLSPWAYDDQNSITFSDVMYRSQILLYIENRPYINYVSQLNITHTGKEVTSKGFRTCRLLPIQLMNMTLKLQAHILLKINLLYGFNLNNPFL